MQTPLAPLTLFGLIRKYREFFLRYKVQIALGVLALLATNLLGIAIPWQIKLAVDSLQATGGTENAAASANPAQWGSFYQHLWIIAGLAVLVLISRVASRQFLLGAGRRLEYDLRNRLYSHLLTMPTSYFAAHPAGELMSRMTNDVDATKYLTGGGIMLGVNTVLAYVLTIPMMLMLNWKLALVTFMLYPIVVWLMSGISRKVREGYRDVQEVLADISTVTQENLNGMMVIQSYVREEHENKRFERICDHYFGTYTRLIRERILLFMLLAGLSGISTLLVLLVGGWQVIANELDWGGFVAFTMYLEHLAWPTMALGWTISIFQQGTAALQRLDDVFSAESNIQSGRPPVTPKDMPETALGTPAPSALSSITGALTIRNLTFSYRNPYTQGDRQATESKASKSAEAVLREVNLTIRPGETVALVGPVGSGKSTLLRLLPRILEVPSGHIFLDDEDITAMPLERLRDAVVFMPQASFLFSSTVSQNIAFGQPSALKSDDHSADSAERIPADVVQAAEVASVHLDIQALPNRYQTLVGERGLMLSGGQRQRVALARAILMDARILILDDPFSNVDAETERNIVSALRARKTFENRTTLIATHRFSLVKLCDRVVLMDEGRVLASGTHQELLASQPLYQTLNRLQELRDSLGSWGLELEQGAEVRQNGNAPAAVELDDELEGA